MTDEIVGQKDDIIMVKPANQLLACAEAMMLGCFTAEYGRMPLHLFCQRLENAAEHNNVHMFYQVSEESEERVPVGFFLVGHLSAPVAKLYIARNRELTKEECNSGPQMWVMENCAPFGHFSKMYSILQAAYPSVPYFLGLVDMKPKTFRNRVYEEAHKEAETEE